MEEEHAKRLFCQLLSAVEYLHTLTILHWCARCAYRQRRLSTAHALATEP